MALIDVNPLGTAKLQEVLWARTPALDLKPSWPVYSHSTGRCVFVGEGPEGMALYEVERGKPTRRSGWNKVLWTSGSPDSRSLPAGDTSSFAAPGRKRHAEDVGV